MDVQTFRRAEEWIRAICTRTVMTMILMSASLVGAIGVIPSPAVAACNSAFAQQPTGSIQGTGGISGCSPQYNLAVALRKQRSFQPDEQFAYTGPVTGYSVTLTAFGSCRGSGKYRTATYYWTGSSSTSKVESSWTQRC